MEEGFRLPTPVVCILFSCFVAAYKNCTCLQGTLVKLNVFVENTSMLFHVEILILMMEFSDTINY